MEPFCTRLRELRGSESQASFAKKIGVSQVTYGRYELGTREPDLTTLTRIGLVAHVSVDYLLGITDKTRNSEAQEKLESLKAAMRALLDKY